jgi:hypothetical protein
MIGEAIHGRFDIEIVESNLIGIILGLIMIATDY